MFKKKKLAKKTTTKQSLNSQNEYHLLIPQDALYKHQLLNLKSPDFRLVISKVTRDLNLLLLMSHDEFWK